MSQFASSIRSACYLCLAGLVAAVPAFSQTVAYVYVESTNQTGNSYIVEAYATQANGRLNKIGSYPLLAISSLIGGNGSYLFAAADGNPDEGIETNIDSYSVETNGGVGPRTESINVVSYAGSACNGASIQSAVLDHTGHYLFVRIFNSENGDCDQWQTYNVVSNGALNYLGSEKSPLIGYLETINPNNNFAYGTTEGSPCASEGVQNAGPRFFPYSRNSAHDLSVDHNFTRADPGPDASSKYTLWASADPAEHLAVLMEDCNNPNNVPARIASYTINPTTGSIASTNTWSEMPETDVDTQVPVNSQAPMFTDMSPSGKLLAVAGEGFQIFHFNGASPLTKFTSLQRGTDTIRQTAWDNSDHFYTLDFWDGELRVFTVTPTSFSEDPGSPVNANGSAIVVVSK